MGGNAGLYASGTDGVFACNNEMFGTLGQGAVLDNLTIDRTQYRQNKHNGITEGMTIQGSSIGEQIHAGNQWSDSGGFLFEPINENRFTINQSQNVSQFSGTLIPSESNIIGQAFNDWFPDDPDGFEYSEKNCATIDPHKSVYGHCCNDKIKRCCYEAEWEPYVPSCESIMLRLIKIFNNQNDGISNSQNYVLKDALLKNNLGLDLIPEEFHDIWKDCLAELFEIQSDINEGYRRTTKGAIGEIKNNLSILNQLDIEVLSKAENIHQQLSNAIEEKKTVVKNELYSFVQVIEENIKALKIELDETIEKQSLIKLERLEMLKRNLEDIRPEDQYDNYNTFVLALELDILEKDSVFFTEIELSKIDEIRHQCPYEFGHAVYKARQWYDMQYDSLVLYNNLEICGSIEQRSIDLTAENLELYLTPNPSQDIPLLYSESDLDQVIINAFDSKGTLVSKRKMDLVTGLNYWTDLNYLSSGVYFIKIETEHIKEVIKMIIIHE